MAHTKNPFKKGFSIVSVLIAAGLMGFLAMLFSQMMTDSLKAKNYLTGAVEIENLKGSLLRVIMDPAKCQDAWITASGSQASFNGSSTNPNRPARVNYAGSQLFAIGSPIVQGLRLEDIEITELSNSPASTPGQTTRSVSLRLVAARDQKVSIGAPKTFSTPINFDFITSNSAANQIVGCNLGGTGGGGTTQTPEQICSSLGGTWNTSAPPPRCDFGSTPTNAQSACEALGFYWNTTSNSCQTDQYKFSDSIQAITNVGLTAGATGGALIDGFKPNVDHIVTITGYANAGLPINTNLVTVNTIETFALPYATSGYGSFITLQKKIRSPALTGTPATSRFRITNKNSGFIIHSITAVRASHYN